MHTRREEELEELSKKPEKTIIAAVQAKKIVNYAERQFSYNAKKYGILNTLIAMKAELQGIVVDRKVFHPVHKESLSKEDIKRMLPTGSLFVIKPKEEEDLLKGRFITKGDKQNRKEFDKYTELVSPTVELVTVYLLLCTAAQHKLAVIVADIKQAFLKAKQQKIQYAKIDKHVSQLLIHFLARNL